MNFNKTNKIFAYRFLFDRLFTLRFHGARDRAHHLHLRLLHTAVAEPRDRLNGLAGRDPRLLLPGVERGPLLVQLPVVWGRNIRLCRLPQQERPVGLQVRL